MRAYRSLVMGMALASLWIVGVACWQIDGKVGDMSHDTHDEDQQPSISRAPGGGAESGSGEGKKDERPSGQPAAEDGAMAEARRQMVERQLAARDVTDERVLDAMRKVPRHLFVPENMRSQAHADGPLPIGHGQTISQPYIVGLMTQLARPEKTDVALDVGTGSGYQAAVLSLLCKEVYSIEIVEPLAETARERLNTLGHENVTVKHGNGYRGWPEKSPFDVIIVAAAPERIPQPLIDQLKPGGRLVIPVGDRFQNLTLVEKELDGSVSKRKVAPVAFVPMTGEVGEDD
ncbi:MAG: protein-L-isoaspartate(D-aspartate) O-methyltransferase [Planctomycetota bacterium]